MVASKNLIFLIENIFFIVVIIFIGLLLHYNLFAILDEHTLRGLAHAATVEVVVIVFFYLFTIDGVDASGGSNRQRVLCRLRGVGVVRAVGDGCLDGSGAGAYDGEGAAGDVDAAGDGDGHV